MKFISILFVAVSIGGLAAGGATAQQQRNVPSKAQKAGNASSSGSNASGSTGFTNRSRDASQGGTTGAGSAGEPATATGLDLNGPAVRYPSGKAPE